MNQSDAAEKRMEICRAYRQLFLNDDGTVKPDGEIVLRDLEKECGWMVERMPTANGSVDPLALAGAYEKRRTFAHIKRRLFEPLEKLKRLAEPKSAGEQKG